MNRVIWIAILAAFFYTSKAQEVEGKWYGLLNVQGTQLRLVMHIENTGDGLKATMDSPDQNAFGIPVSEVTFENKELRIAISAMMMEYTGTMEGDSIKGTFRQAGISLPMNLKREIIKKSLFKRLQEPTEPYPYHTEEVKFLNRMDHIQLAGTITLPSGPGPFPAVVLISGSGPQNRDSEIFGHKPFWVLADFLTRNGIAVLRYDDRGIAHSEGNFATATTVDFARDAQSAVEYLITRADVSHTKIGLIGHSEGGIIAPIAAEGLTDVSFLVLMAGSGFTGAEIIFMQQRLIGQVSGVPGPELDKAAAINREAFEIVNQHDNLQEMENDLKSFFRKVMGEGLAIQKPAGVEEAQYAESLARQLANPWMKYFLAYNPLPVLERTTIPVLVLNGEKDLQVPCDENLTAITGALYRAGNKKVTVRKLPNLNHLFQECETGSPAEYAGIEQTMSPAALTEIAVWIKKITE